MATDKHLTRFTIGPNTDRRAAIVVLAQHILDAEARALADAEQSVANWQNRRPSVLDKNDSLREARRHHRKAVARVAAAQDLYNLAVAYNERRAYIFHDAPETSQEAREAAHIAGATTESSGQNQAVSDRSDEPDSGDQATVSYGNCACCRYAITPEMGGFTIYGHHPRCLLPLTGVNPDDRPFWPSWVNGVALIPSIIGRMEGEGL